MLEFKITTIKTKEIADVAEFISRGYFDDIFFHWVVPSDADRLKIITDYYIAYLSAPGCVSHIARSNEGELVGATVWLPHDVDASVYEEIDKCAGIYQSNFQEVADKSHANEPTEWPFYQLVAVVTKKEKQGLGIGGALLKEQIDHLDAIGVGTYLEASTPYHGGGVYGKFGYQFYSDLMNFADGIALYPLYRPAGGFEND